MLNQELAEYRGEVYFASTGRAPKGSVTLGQIPGRTYQHDEGFEYVPASLKSEKVVPIPELDAWYVDKMVLTWRGQPFGVDRIEDDRIHAGYAGTDGGWAKDNGLEGNHYDGYSGWLPRAEVEELRTDRTDYLARWKERNAG